MNPIELAPIQFDKSNYYIMKKCLDHCGNIWDYDSHNLTENCNLYLYTNGPIPNHPIPGHPINGISFARCVCPQFTYFGPALTYRLYLNTNERQLGRYVIVVPKPIDAQLHEAIQEFNTTVIGYIKPILTI